MRARERGAIAALSLPLNDAKMQADDGAGMSGEHVSLTPQELDRLLHEGGCCLGGWEAAALSRAAARL